MAQPSVDDFGALVEALSAAQAKRHPLEERLRSIEEKRGTVQPQVFEKVHREAREKLDALDAEFRALRARVSQARSGLSEQEAALGAALDQAKGELEEIRFRNTLGEYAPEEFHEREREINQRVIERSSQLQTLSETAALFDTFLRSVPPEPAPETGPRPAAPDPSPQPRLAAPSAPPPAAAPAVSEMEALFGTAGIAPARPTAAPPDHDVFERTRTSGSYKPHGATGLPPEETTEDIQLGEMPAKPSFPSAPVEGAPFRPTLIVKTRERGGAEDTYELTPGATLIGRAPENDVILLEESVSRRHARILVEKGECLFEDLGSANGSFINGEKVRPKAPRKLMDRDVIKMGQLLAFFRVSPED